jgi:predicted AAA+ superfamily ATPase
MATPPINLETPLPRHAAVRIREALKDTRIVAIVGPRQSGKTTLAQQVGGHAHPFITLDDETARSFAQTDPTGFVRGLDMAVIDEIQRAPGLVLALKKSVDEDHRPGRFILTGSADLFAGSLAPDSLAGRIETVRLLPLSQSELRRRDPPTFLDDAFGAFTTARRLPRDGDLEQMVLAGGFPEALSRANAKRRADWFAAYIDALTQRDIPDLASIDKVGVLPRLIDYAALYAGQIVNLSELGARLHIDGKTVDRWLTLLEQVFLARRIPPWFRNGFKRLAKSPKLHFYDTGLLAAIRGIDVAHLASNRQAFGGLLESFVFAELSKIIATSEHRTSISHYRDKDQVEVDFVLERPGGQVVAIEVKASATAGPDDFKGLKRVREAAGAGFRAGFLLYDGDNLIQMDENLYASPFSILWA